MKNIHQIITDIDDQDAYKFFMQYAVIKNYPDAWVEYTYILRDKTIKFPDGFGKELQRQIEMMTDLTFTPDIIMNLGLKLPFFDTPYIQYLKSYRYNSNEVDVKQVDGDLHIHIAGYWHSAINWEVDLLAVITELYYIFKTKDNPGLLDSELLYDSKTNREILIDKLKAFRKHDFKVAEFGTRRRFSKRNQQFVIEMFLKHAPEQLLGTSNVWLSRLYDLKSIGTMAHEWIMFHAAKYGPEQANREMLGKWVETFHGHLGIALPDTYTTDVFLRSFDMFHAKLWDGPRHDSGCPIEYAEKIIKHYRDLNIVLPGGLVPKSIPFSDNINSIKKMLDIKKACDKRILHSYGVGTWLTNDVFGFNPMNHVIKMTAATPSGMMRRETVKLSDDTGKITGDKATAKIYKKLLNI